MNIQFLGAARTVTGSKFLVSVHKRNYLVDCGLYQGLKELRLQNWAPLPFPARSIDAVILTHAHLDHCGYLPLLFNQGFRGEIFCTAPTRDLAEIILSDSARLQEEDAGFANREGYSKHSPAKPLYTLDDVKETLKRFKPVRRGHWENLGNETRFRLTPSSHILGSAFVELQAEGKTIAFSGDLGRRDPLLYPPPSQIEEADYLVIESTYGDRTHHPEDALARLARVTEETYSRGGHLIIPSFAVGRVQDLLYLFSRLQAEQKMPGMPIFLDTPMGVNATRVFANHPDWHRLAPEEVEALCRSAKIVSSQQESIEVMRAKEPCVVIAGSGMVSGGRVLHHLASKLPDPRSTALLVGFQAAGTRGRLLQEGISELKLHGKYVPVRARVEQIPGLSAHADQSEILDWLRGFRRAPKRTFIVHGEPQASEALLVKMRDTLGWEATVPVLGQLAELS